jgi:pseudaminic acid synthase
MAVRIGNIDIGPGHPCALVAELSCNHGQDFRRMCRMMDAAKEAGATLAKIQAYSPSELIALRGDGQAPAPWDYMTMRELYTKAMTPREWMPALFAYSEAIELPLFASVFGAESLELMERMGCPAYKLASFERDDVGLRLLVEATGKPIIISRPDHPEPGVPTLLCVEGYPQKEHPLQRIRAEGFFGYSYHGDTYNSPALSALFGAHMVEVHFQLDDERGEFEDEVSLTASEFAKMARAVRHQEAMAAA